MLTISNLNLKPQHIYRIEPPRGDYHLEFKLDPKSEYYLIEEARNLDSERDVETFENGIQEAAIIAALKIPEKELRSKDVLEWKRLQIDPKYTQRMFAFQIKQGNAKNKLLITKAEVIANSDYSKTEDEDSREVNLNLDYQSVSTNVFIKPIDIEYLLDESTISYLDNLTEGYSEDEIKELESRIRRAVRIAAHKMNKNGLILKPHGTKIRWRFEDLEYGKEFKFQFTAINGRRFLVKKIRIKDFYPNLS